MDIQEIAQEVISAHGGIARAADFVTAGVRETDVVKLCRAGYLTRIRHGYYCLADEEDISEERLLAALIPRGIVCVESALFHYGYSDFTPRRWSIAVPRTMSRTKLETEGLPLRVYYVQAEIHDLGKTSDSFQGVTLSVYDRERTVCDCFKYRARLDSELFSKALRAYAGDAEKNPGRLSAYARKLRVYNKMTPLMEVLLND
ncbi:MAG: type IV toxin-antitoxin system AbiEi family antitoxin domain-containing protein [Oscillospiraceae bacterium]|nr:type IV toxin-antitoxin system AbiEi family antitoxin domain-containing protein [Oscillospiraceae bacterium]